MSSSGSPLSNASNDANQNMSSSPAGSSSPSCGSSPESSSSNQTVSPSKTHWIAIQLVDDQGHAVPYEDYRITLPNGTIIEDSLDNHGRTKISGIDSGACKVSFPNLDQDLWEPA